MCRKIQRNTARIDPRRAHSRGTAYEQRIASLAREQLCYAVADGRLLYSREMLVMSRTYQVEAHWDSEAGVWVAESDDIPGLVAEAESMNALVEKVRILVPELFELNGGLEPGQKVVDVLVRAHHEETASVPVGS